MPAKSPQAIQKMRENWNKKRRLTSLKGRPATNTPGNNLLFDAMEQGALCTIGNDTAPMLFVLVNPSETDRNKWEIRAVPASNFVGMTERAVRECEYNVIEGKAQREQDEERLNAADNLLLKRLGIEL